jgi:hypothetical protein
LRGFLVNVAILRMFTRRFNPNLANKINEMFTQWLIHHGSLADHKNQLDDGGGYWQTTPLIRSGMMVKNNLVGVHFVTQGISDQYVGKHWGSNGVSSLKTSI